MRENIVQLDKIAHADLKLIGKLDVKRFSHQGMAPVIIHEMAPLATEFPLVFVKNSDTGEFTCVALLGLGPEENLFVKNGSWQGEQIPAILTHLPLSVSVHPRDDEQLVVLIDTSSELVSEKAGDSLFDDDKNETEYLKKRVASMISYHQCSRTTRSFVKKITDLGLLELQRFSFELAGQRKNVDGMYFISRQKFNTMSDTNFCELRKENFLEAIYHHFSSLHNFSAQIKRANRLEALG